MPSMRRGIAAKGRANARYPVILRDSPSLGKDVADGLFAGADFESDDEPDDVFGDLQLLHGWVGAAAGGEAERAGGEAEWGMFRGGDGSGSVARCVGDRWRSLSISSARIDSASATRTRRIA